MARKHPDKRAAPRTAVRRSATEVRVEQVPLKQVWRLLHPRCALERAADLEEVGEMIQHDELEIATDELRWLLGGCPNLLAAHRLLGEAALKAGDVALARGHFGQAYYAVHRALDAAGRPRPLPFAIDENRDFFLCGRQLAQCLLQLGKGQMAGEVIEELLRCDPSDPLRLNQLRQHKEEA